MVCGSVAPPQGKRTERLSIMREFVAGFEGKTGAELQREMGQTTSLLLMRFCASLHTR